MRHTAQRDGRDPLIMGVDDHGGGTHERRLGEESAAGRVSVVSVCVCVYGYGWWW